MQYTMLLLTVLLTMVVDLHNVGASFSCKNMKGDEIDWSMALKLPRLRESSDPNIAKGLGFVYLDKDKSTWGLTKSPINETDNAISRTIQQLYASSGKESVSYVMYNDETPGGGKSFDGGHTKGLLLFDKTSGFWLVHSVPKFPPASNQSYAYPSSGMHYGQSFLCISFKYKYLENIAKQLLYTDPNIYDIHVPASFVHDNPALAALVNKTHVKKAPWTSKQLLTSAGGQAFISFAKAGHFGEDLYAAWVAPTLKSGLLVESWQNGAHKLTTNCSGPYHVYNVKKLSIMSTDYKETQDHSKWAVSIKDNWTCIGGINRQEHQELRGGGTVCVQLQSVWKAFNTTIQGVEQCPHLL